MPGLPADVVKNELNLIFDRCRDMNLNAVILQVRPSGDAFYASNLEPWSYFLTGRQGVNPFPDYDPLAEAVKEAHRRGLELHVWVNPYRALHERHAGEVSPNHFLSKNPEHVVTYGKYRWMDPGSTVVQDHTYRVIIDVLERYDIDGVHIDDYFYPYPEGGRDFPDEASYNQYVLSGGRLLKDDWRRENVNKFIKKLYDGIKSRKRWVKFGISPFGIWRPGNPAQIKGFDQYSSLYADAKKWLNEGWCDYFTPQLYWPIDKYEQSFPVLLDWWIGENYRNRHIWPGHYTSRLNPSDGDWRAEEILNQIQVIRERPGTKGTVHFSMKAFMRDWKGINSAMALGPFRTKALVPESPWLSDERPAAPRVVSSATETIGGDPCWVVRVRPGSSRRIRFFVLSQKLGDRQEILMVSDSPGFVWNLAETIPDTLYVSAVDYFGNSSEVVAVRKP